MLRSRQLADVFRKLLAEHSTLLSSVSAPVPMPPRVPKSYQLWYELPESDKLMQMLLDGDSQKFVDCLLGHFEVFAKFIPVLDEIFPEKPEK